MNIDDYAKININPIFEPIKRIFEFYVLGSIFVPQHEFQKFVIQSHPELAALINDYNHEVDVKIENQTTKTKTALYFTSIGRLMIIAVFDILQFSKYHNKIKKDEIYKFTKHLRNGAAHDNKFEISPPLKKPICWQNKTITNSLNGSTVIPDFIDPITIIYLLSDITELIK
ncbi:MAG: hypothetical protein WC725_02510 [Patescibacteria group bacterium]|jgi:hypothetical protein